MTTQMKNEAEKKERSLQIILQTDRQTTTKYQKKKHTENNAKSVYALEITRCSIMSNELSYGNLTKFNNDEFETYAHQFMFVFLLNNIIVIT